MWKNQLEDKHLKSCPFCGRQPVLDYFETIEVWRVLCECGAISPSNSKSKLGARKIWNRRMELTEHPL